MSRTYRLGRRKVLLSAGALVTLAYFALLLTFLAPEPVDLEPQPAPAWEALREVNAAPHPGPARAGGLASLSSGVPAPLAAARVRGPSAQASSARGELLSASEQGEALLALRHEPHPARRRELLRCLARTLALDPAPRVRLPELLDLGARLERAEELLAWGQLLELLVPKLAPPPTPQAFERALVGSQRVLFSRLLVRGLELLGSQGALERVVTGAAPPKVKAEALGALVRSASPQALPLLLQALGAPGLEQASFRLLSALRDPQLAPRLREHFTQRVGAQASPAELQALARALVARSAAPDAWVAARATGAGAAAPALCAALGRALTTSRASLLERVLRAGASPQAREVALRALHRAGRVAKTRLERLRADPALSPLAYRLLKGSDSQ